jgi:hypothetical protein
MPSHVLQEPDARCFALFVRDQGGTTRHESSATSIVANVRPSGAIVAFIV